MPPRFYAPGAGAAPIVTLPDEEALHLTRVLRLDAGALVTVFDGEGLEFLARVDQIDRAHVRVRVLEPTHPAAESAVRIRLAQSALKGDSMDAVIRDATMLGVFEVQPVVAARVNSSRTALGRSGVRERWRRIAISSAKQCGRAVVPHVGEPLSLAELLKTDASVSRLILVEPSASGVGGLIPIRTLLGSPPPASCTVLVGAEGGWTEEEVLRAAETGFTPVSLGARTLRAEAVALTALALLQFVWGEL